MLRTPALPQGGWHFDLTSAILGAALAWLLTALLYLRREEISRAARHISQRLRSLQRDLQAGRDTVYARALQEALRQRLLFAPGNPRLVFRPPKLKVACLPLPTSNGEPPPLPIAFGDLLKGHPRLILRGRPGAGRTTAMVVAALNVLRPSERKRPFTRFPVWVDLAVYVPLPTPTPPLEQLARIAALTPPSPPPSWLATRLRTFPSLVLVDNWDAIAPEARDEVAHWLAEAAQSLRDSVWIVAGGDEGDGPLVERGFVPLKLSYVHERKATVTLYTAWAKAMGQPDEPPSEDILSLWDEAAEAGASWMELTARVVLHLRTGLAPRRPVEVLDALLRDALTPPQTKGEEQLVEEAQAMALTALGFLAERELTGEHVSRQQLFDFVAALLPPEETRSPKLERTIHRLIEKSGLVRREGKRWTLSHSLWRDFLAAWVLAGEEEGESRIATYADDPRYSSLVEFYAAMGEMGGLVRLRLEQALAEGNDDDLLRIARWCWVAPPDAPWRREVMQAMARRFRATPTTTAVRLRLGRMLTLLAGEQALAFFIQTLRHPSAAVRSAALRGIGWLGSPRGIDLLRGAILEADSEMQRSAVEALGDLGTPGAIELLWQTYLEADEMFMPHIAEVLARWPEGHERLREAAEHADLLVRRAACYGLERIEAPWAETLLVKMAQEDPEWLVRSAAEAALKARQERAQAHPSVPPPPQVDHLEWLITWAAQQGMGLGVGEAAWKMLRRAVREGPSDVRRQGLGLLACFGRRQDAEMLRRLRFEVRDEAVRQVLDDALHRIERRYTVHWKGQLVVLESAQPLVGGDQDGV